MRRKLLLMAKAPTPGKVKTRLIPVLGADGAAEIAKKLLRAQVSSLLNFPGASLDMFVTPADARFWFEQQFPEVLRVSPQADGHLGQRMQAAFEASLAQGDTIADVALMTGSDVLPIPETYLESGFLALERQVADVVFGPARDGGYYLIGLRRVHPCLFDGIPWSSPHTLEKSLEVAKANGLRVKLLPTWYDIDRPEDLPLMHQFFAGDLQCR